MRNAIYATFLFAAVSSAAMAQTQTQQRPVEAAPAATAAFEQRESWCQKYASWFVERTPVVGASPTDVRPTQRVENEINYCKLDPRQYERETLAELARANAES
jgi:hypothetical protein